MLTAYSYEPQATSHLGQLEPGEGKVLNLQNEETVKHIKQLLQLNSGYQFFYSATKDKDARKKLITEHRERIKQYSITNYRGHFEFGVKVEAGQLYGTYSYEKQTIGVLFYDIIK
ncbi:hypothetical protein [Chitinophaga agri]|uniref:Uncharacterized protein n=1 Tax=Chitinophaga agri TaxID=2703787 RepID=A0A6B9ZB27_9BACT|nr:hypothetical protein [Chitinophaga agri]QHS58315.1 hypothetical protein GWR21_01515 [Chitinophaga agri]